jgi:hypothetical protein
MNRKSPISAPTPARPSSLALLPALVLAITLILTAPAPLLAQPMSNMTPPHLLEQVRSEITAGSPASAASSFMVAMAYSFYDARRSSGEESRKVFAELSALALADLPSDQLGSFAAAGRSLASNPMKISDLLSAAGRPTYDLSYLGEGTVSRADFDPQSAWSEVVAGLSRSPLVPR